MNKIIGVRYGDQDHGAFLREQAELTSNRPMTPLYKAIDRDHRGLLEELRNEYMQPQVSVLDGNETSQKFDQGENVSEELSRKNLVR